ncbi:hypothetical protein [Streptomyces cadmiisoli]|uniref:hypothetical protein n=1 Tax=Streptomyces cadmiisoli TaxID=2184053 RepID=UPI0036647361
MPRTSNPPPPPPGYIWSDEAARRMSITRRTLWNYRHIGKGPEPQRYRGRLAYSIADVEAHIAAELGTSEPDADRVRESRPPEPRLTRKPARTPAAA